MTSVVFGTPYKKEFSARNADIVRREVAKRFPDWLPRCEPYVNVLPLRAWNERGFRVKRGEKAIKVWTMVPVFRKSESTGENEKVGERRTIANVFAYPQVEER